MIQETITCDYCYLDFIIDRSTGENLDLDNRTPVCPNCELTQNFAFGLDRHKIRPIIDKDKTKFKEAD